MAMLKNILYEQGRKASEAARILSIASTEEKNEALFAMAAALRKGGGEIMNANALDLAEGEKNGLPQPLLERLTLNGERIEGMARGLEEIAALKDPVGEGLGSWKNRDGLEIGRVRVPLGVIGTIYESRPNVTADAAGLCLKAGNAVILRGGKEALNSNRAIAGLISEAAVRSGMPEGCIQLVDSSDREATAILMRMNDYLDVLIPRGGKGLKKAVQENATVPFIMTGMGLCHIYVDASADINMATEIIVNAKAQRPSVCNAAETLLVHEAIAEKFLPTAAAALRRAGVEVRGDGRSRAIVPDLKEATSEDWATEYLDLILSVKVVGSLDEAMNHIHVYGSGHSEAIVTESYASAQKFLVGVDAAAVYVNASTRFTDGGVFGFGAEMGISTQKLHARGPMGVEQLTTTKLIIRGKGQIRK